MDINKILNSDYLDLLFEGRNKKYGSYDLRRRYRRRIVLGAAIAFIVFIGFFLTTLIKPKQNVEAAAPIIRNVKLTQPPPLDPNKPPPPPPPPKSIPPPVKPTVKFTPPVIKKDNQVKEEDKPTPPKPDQNAVVSFKNTQGSEDPNAINPNLNMNPGTGNGPVSSGPTEKIFRFVDQQAEPPGGLAAFQKYLARHTNYPVDARQAQISGRVTYQFVVDKQGHISDITILKDIGGGCGNAVKEVLEKYNKRWTPAKNNGHPVKAYYVGSFSFTLR